MADTKIPPVVSGCKAPAQDIVMRLQVWADYNYHEIHHPSACELFASAADEIETLRSAIRNLLPLGNPTLPDDRVFPIYVRMSELRALHALIDRA